MLAAKSDSGYLVDTVDREGERCLIEADRYSTPLVAGCAQSETNAQTCM
jgi:hypothetical protein